MKTVSPADVIAGLRNELAAVVGALVEKTAAVREATTAPDGGYIVSIEAAQGGRGTLEIHFDGAGVAALAGRIGPRQDAAPDAAAVESLKEICTQAAMSYVDKQPCVGVRLVVAGVRMPASPDATSTTASTPPAGSTLVEISLEGEDTLLRLALSGTLELVDAATTGPDASAGARPSLDVLLDMELPLVVRFGRTELPLKTLAGIGPGSVIDLGRSPDDPVEILVSNQVIAIGDVVVVGGNYGVRIREVISAAERVRSLETR